MSFCVSCGRPVNGDDRFCTACGVATDSPETTASTHSKAPRSHSAIKIVLILAALALCAFAAIGYGAYRAKQALVHALQNENSSAENASSDSPSPETKAPKDLQEALAHASPETQQFLAELKKRGIDPVTAGKKLREMSPTVMCKLSNGEIVHSYPGAKVYLGDFKVPDAPIDMDPHTYLVTNAAPSAVAGWLKSNNRCLEGPRADGGAFYLAFKDEPIECSGSEQGVAVHNTNDGTVIAFTCPPTEEDVKMQSEPIEHD